jgi:hypothetical protein
MRERTEHRLTVLGETRPVEKFQRSHWDKVIGARFVELAQCSQRRFVVLFETERLELASLQALFRRWPQLVFLLDYEVTRRRRKGLVRTSAGKLLHCQIRY